MSETNCKHQWQKYLPLAKGYYSKRDDGQTNDVFWYEGAVDTCLNMGCETFLFKPFGSGLVSVECELKQ